MRGNFDFWIWLFSAVIFLDIFLCGLVLRKKNKVTKPLTLTIVAAIYTTLFYTLSFVCENYFFSSLFSSLYFIGIDCIVICLMWFVSVFTDINLKTSKGIIFIYTFGIYFVFDAVVLLINPFKEIVISYNQIVYLNHIVYKYDERLLFYMHLAYCYIIVVATLLLLLNRIARTPSVYRDRYYTVMGVFIFIVALNAVYLIGSELFTLDISVLFYSVGIVLFYLVTFRYVPNNSYKAAREYVVENMDRPIIVFDHNNNVIDTNKKARDIFPGIAPKVRAEKEPEEINAYFEWMNFPSPADLLPEFEWTHIKGGSETRYQCETNKFTDKRGDVIGKMVLMNDISHMRDSATGLELAPRFYQYIDGLDKLINHPVQILAVNMNKLSDINKLHGREKGDFAMARIADIMINVLGREVMLAKLDDGTIAAVLPKTTLTRARELAEEIQQTARKDISQGFTIYTEYGISELDIEGQNYRDKVNEAVRSMKNRKLLSDTASDSSLISSLTQTLLENDFETVEHVERTRKTSKKLSKVLGLSDKESGDLELLCMLHDIGKVAVPLEILLKAGSLDPQEWEIMKSHTGKGYRIAQASDELGDIAEAILHHHERFDGKGYPSGLAGEDIPKLSRIVSVLDSFDVMVNDRPYRKAMPVEDAKKELVACSGSQFDPAIVEAFLTIVDEAY